MVFNEVTAERQRQVPLLNKFKCRVCDKYKEPGLYSNNELNKFRYRYTTGERPTPVSAKLRCRFCSGADIHERQCVRCEIWKDLQQFSRSARMAGGSGRCQACTLWHEAAESEIIPQAPPGGDLAPDEDPYQPSINDQTTTTQGTEYYSDPEAGGADSDEDYSVAPTPTISAYTPSAAAPTASRGSASTWGPDASVASSTVAMSQLSVGSNGWATQGARQLSTNGLSASGVAQPRVQPSLGSNGWATQGVRPVNQPSTNGLSVSGASQPRVNPGNLAFNMGAGPRMTSDTRTASSASNPYEGQASASASQSGSAVAGPSREPPRNFNAWDSNGIEYIQRRFASDSRSETGSTITNTTASTATTVVRPTAPPAPSGSRTNSNWAKPIGTKSKPAPYNALDHQSQQPPRRRDQHGDSDDDM